MKIKKLAALMLSAATIMSLTACGKTAETNTSTNGASVENTTKASTMTTKYDEGYNFDYSNFEWYVKAEPACGRTETYNNYINHLNHIKIADGYPEEDSFYTSDGTLVVDMNTVGASEEDVKELIYKDTIMNAYWNNCDTTNGVKFTNVPKWYWRTLDADNEEIKSSTYFTSIETTYIHPIVIRFVKKDQIEVTTISIVNEVDAETKLTNTRVYRFVNMYLYVEGQGWCYNSLEDRKSSTLDMYYQWEAKTNQIFINKDEITY